jgi:nucleoside 2-deoxyribosyltransferase
MKSIRRIYLAGPMRGYEDYNIPAFEKAASKLRNQGYEVIVPHEIDVAKNRDPRVVGDVPLRVYMADDLPEVCKSDLVVMLPGWHMSQGARLERLVASEVGIPVKELEEL